jgi:hypothetical protein
MFVEGSPSHRGCVEVAAVAGDLTIIGISPISRRRHRRRVRVADGRDPVVSEVRERVSVKELVKAQVWFW